MKTKILLLLIILLATFLRTFQLSQFPKTLYGDEQAFAWNAYNILKLGQDEYGNPYPLQFRSFDDYKAPIPVYLLVPFIKFLGLNAFSIRLPIAIASILTVLFLYFLAQLFFNKKISLLIAFLLAISPWHIHLSRGFFEATLSLLFMVLGIYFFLLYNSKLRNMFISMFFFGLSIYSYFVPRIILPFFLILLFFFLFNKYRLSNKNFIKHYIFGLIFLFIISLPLLKLTFQDRGFSRMQKLTDTQNQVVIETVNKDRNTSALPQIWRNIIHNKATVWFRLIKTNYLEHLSANFWYISGDSSLRYFTGNMGMFYLVEFPLFIIGLYFLLREKRSIAIFFILWLLITPIPASLVGRPFAVRSIFMLPAPFIFVGFGLYKFIEIIYRPRIKLLLVGIISIGLIVSLGSLLVRYYFEYPTFAATWWGWENWKAISYAKERENLYQNIFISDFYTGSTLAFAVYNSYDPLNYRYAITHPITLADNRHLIKLGKYYFGSLDIDSKRLSQHIIPPKSLYIGRPEEAQSTNTINAPDDGRLIFNIYSTD